MNKLFAAAILGLAAPVPAFAAPVPPAMVATEQLDQLVQLLLPEDSLLKLGAHAFEVGYAAEIANDPAGKALQDRYPGLGAYIVAQLRPELMRMMAKEIPALRREIRAIVAAGLTAPEISDTLTFFASPTGAKLRAHVYTTIGAKPGQSVEAMRADAVESAMASMDAEDFPALVAFGASTAAQKMQTVNPRIQAASQAWSDRLVVQNRTRLRALAEQATKRYLAEHNGNQSK